MKSYPSEKYSRAETAGEAENSSVFFENITAISPGPLCSKPGVIVKLYGMSLMVDETSGKVIITNSILKNAPARNFLDIQGNKK